MRCVINFTTNKKNFNKLKFGSEVFWLKNGNKLVFSDQFSSPEQTATHLICFKRAGERTSSECSRRMTTERSLRPMTEVAFICLESRPSRRSAAVLARQAGKCVACYKRERFTQRLLSPQSGIEIGRNSPYFWGQVSPYFWTHVPHIGFLFLSKKIWLKMCTKIGENKKIKGEFG